MLYFLAFVLALILVSCAKDALRKPFNEYVAVNDDLTIAARPDYADAMLSDVDVKRFFKKAVIASLSADWKNINSQLSRAATNYYTTQGGKDYLQQLKKAQIIRYIKSRQVWGVETVDDIQIIKNGLINSKVGKVHYWTVQGLVKVVRSNSIVSKEKASMYSANFAIKMVIVRQNPLEHKDGVAIMKFFIEQIHDEN